MVFKSLRLDEVDQWKQKYETLANLYAQLRKEHIDLLETFRILKDSSTNISEESFREIQRIKEELWLKNSEISILIVERERIKEELEIFKRDQHDESINFKQEIEYLKGTINNILREKDSVIRSITDKFTFEKDMYENTKDQIINELKLKIDDFQKEAQNVFVYLIN